MYSGLDLMGDGLMKLPFLRALRHAYPQARITWLAGLGDSVFAGALAPLIIPLLDEVIQSADIGRKWSECLRPPLPDRRFDLVIDTQRRVKTTLILRRIRHGRFVSGSAGFLLSDVKPRRPYAKKPRMIDNMLDLVGVASGKPAMPEGALSIDPLFTAAAARALPHGPRYVALAPGAGGAHKRWPLERYLLLANELRAEGMSPVFLLGPAEAAWTTQIAAWPMPLQDPAIDATLAASPLFTIAVAAHCAAGVANDSGTGHMIAAADIPLVSLFGPTDPGKFAPYVTRGRVVRAQDFRGSDMDAIPVAAVLQAIQGFFPFQQ